MKCLLATTDQCDHFIGKLFDQNYQLNFAACEKNWPYITSKDVAHDKVFLLHMLICSLPPISSSTEYKYNCTRRNNFFVSVLLTKN
jgi:hypothetical protein